VDSYYIVMNIFNKVRQALENQVTNVLNGELERIAEQARQNSSGLSSRYDETEDTRPISDAIGIIPAQKMGGKIVGAINVDLEIAPAARAWEYGSGEWGDLGDKYPISPVNQDFMIFEWYPPLGDITANGLPWVVDYGDGGGIVAFSTTVMHPGIQARPYLRPAIQKYTESLRGKLANAVKLEVGVMFSGDIKG